MTDGPSLLSLSRRGAARSHWEHLCQRGRTCCCHGLLGALGCGAGGGAQRAKTGESGVGECGGGRDTRGYSRQREHDGRVGGEGHGGEGGVEHLEGREGLRQRGQGSERERERARGSGGGHVDGSQGAQSSAERMVQECQHIPLSPKPSTPPQKKEKKRSAVGKKDQHKQDGAGRKKEGALPVLFFFCMHFVSLGCTSPFSVPQDTPPLTPPPPSTPPNVTLWPHNGPKKAQLPGSYGALPLPEFLTSERTHDRDRGR